MKKKVITTGLGIFILLINGITFAGFNSPSHLSVNASAKVSRYKAKIWSYHARNRQKIDQDFILGAKKKGACGEIKILADKGQPIIILGDIINLARCKKSF